MPPKKTFNANLLEALNPALQFISPESLASVEMKKEKATKGAGKASQKDGQKDGQGIAQKCDAQKSSGQKNDGQKCGGLQCDELKNNKQKSLEKSSSKEKKHIGPRREEKKSKRIQLLFQPSLHAKLKEKAEQEHTSINEYIHSILEGVLSHKNV